MVDMLFAKQAPHTVKYIITQRNFFMRSNSGYAPSVNKLALPPAAVVFTVSVRSVVKRSK